ncbi:MAG: hypothetical protein MHM6MM_003810 [Cercozoa sp. M6MM]
MMDISQVKLPLGYVQVVTIVVYMRMFVRLVVTTVSPLPFPLFGVLEYFFVVGWLKTGVMMFDPFGDDEGDINLAGFFATDLRNATVVLDPDTADVFTSKKP